MNKKLLLIKENYYYQKAFLKKLGISEKFINKLFQFGIGKVKNSDDSMICFNFVGLVSLNEISIAFYPKYVDIIWSLNTSEDITKILMDKIIKIIKVLKKYDNKTVYSYYDSFFINKHEKSNEISDLALADFFIKDFLNKGLYIKNYKEYVLNSSGDISWDKTINDLDPYIIKEKPVYFNTYNIKKDFEQDKIITEAHKWAIDWSIKNYSKLLGYNDIFLKENFSVDINKLGSDNYIVSQIDKELSITYEDRNLNLLKSLKELFSRQEYNAITNNLSLYGTSNFYFIWENICSYIFDNERNHYSFPKPKWKPNIDLFKINNFLNNNDIKTEQELNPDVIKTIKKNIFYLIDAKYRNIKFSIDKNDIRIDHSIELYDITKQLLYYRALDKKIDKYKKAYNIFLFPRFQYETEKLFTVIGNVNLDFMELPPIFIVYLNEDIVYDYYLQNIKLNKFQLDNLSYRIEKANIK